MPDYYHLYGTHDHLKSLKIENKCDCVCTIIATVILRHRHSTSVEAWSSGDRVIKKTQLRPRPRVWFFF